MSIDNSITVERIKRVLTTRAIAIVLLIVAIASTVFYITLENIERRDILIWLVTEDAQVGFPDDTIKLVNSYASQRGVDKVVLSRRNPSDIYFDVAMSTSAYYNCDIFIMREELVQKYAELSMFLPLTGGDYPTDDLLYVGSDAVGIVVFEDYYLLINAKCDVDSEIIYDILDLLIQSNEE